MMEVLQKDQTFLELGTSSQPRSLSDERCLIFKQLYPALNLCAGFGCLPGALDPTPTHFIVLQLGSNIEDTFCKDVFFTNGVNVLEGS